MSRRKAIKTQIAEGDPRKKGKRKLQNELNRLPKTMSGIPDCPTHLKGRRAREVWRFLREQLETMDIDARPDVLTLEGLVTSYILATDADRLIARQGIAIEEPVYHRGVQVGTICKNHPALRTRNMAWGRFLAFADRFGLSPEARQWLAVDRPDLSSDAEMERLLSGPTLTDEEKAEITRSYEKKLPQ